MDGSCVLFNKYGYYVDSIFWDNLTYGNVIKHMGDKLLAGSDDEEDDQGAHADAEEENICVRVCYFDFFFDGIVV